MMNHMELSRGGRERPQPRLEFGEGQRMSRNSTGKAGLGKCDAGVGATGVRAQVCLLGLSPAGLGDRGGKVES